MSIAPTVLVATALHAESLSGLAKILPIWAHWSRPDFAFIIAVNGPDSQALAKLVSQAIKSYPALKIKVMAVGCGSGDSVWRHQVIAQQAMFESALELGCERLLWHEVSRIPLPGTLDYLLNTDLPVAGALYRDTYQPGYFCVWDFDPVFEKHHHHPYLLIDQIRQPTQVSAIGFGFTLIKLSVLKQVTLRVGVGSGADTWFGVDLQKLKIPIYACPVLAFNTKVDGEPFMRELWHRTRARLLAEAQIC